MIEEAVRYCEQADIFIIIGTSMNVYPAAGLIHYVPQNAPVFLIDPNQVNVPAYVKVIQKGASEGMKQLKTLLIEQFA